MEDNVNFHLIRVMNRFVKGIFNRTNRHIREHGLTETQFIVLEMLHSKGTLTVNEIIERSISTDGNIGIVICNLIRNGLVEKTPDQSDRRVRRVSLTPKGAQVIRDYFPLHEDFVNKIFADVSTKDIEELIALMKKIGKQL